MESVNKAESPPVESGVCCPECDYNLTGLTSDRCPWCGWKLDADVLIADARRPSHAYRFSVAFVAMIVGLGALLALVTLVLRGKRLSLEDGFAVLAVLVAVAGHLSLSVLALLSRRRWPMRPGTAADLLRFLGWLSIAAGVAAATRFLFVAPTPRFVRDVQVNGVLEFVVAGALFTLPGAMLLILRLVSFKSSAEALTPPRKAGEPSTSSLPTQASYAVEFVGRYASDQVRSTWTDARRLTTPALDALISRTWEAQRALAQEDGQMLFNGELVRLVRHETAARTLTLHTGPTNFRDFAGTHLYNASHVAAHHPECFADALGISAVPVTRDGMIALGRRGPNVAFHAGFLHPLGGIVDPSDRRADGSADVFGAMLRELFEELAIESQEVANVAVIALVRDRQLLQPELLFDVSLELTRDELAARSNPSADGQEHTGIEFVRDEPDAILPFLRRAAPVTPVVEAALLIHGRLSWGTDWYEQSCYVLFGELPPQSV